VLTLLLLLLAGQIYPATDDAPDTAPATASVLEVRTWTGLKQAFSTIQLPAHEYADDERGLR
jgi:hypothetical protein